MHARNQALEKEAADRVRIEWYESPGSVLRLRDLWDRLLDQWNVDCVFLSWDWIRVWLRTYGSGCRLLVGLVFDGQEPIGLAPLFISRRRLFPGGPILRSVNLLGDGSLCPDHLVLPTAPGRERQFAEALFAALQERKDRWDRVELRDLLAEHPAWGAFREVAEAGGVGVKVRATTHCPYIPLPAIWDDYLSSLGKKTRATIRQRLKRIERSFQTELVHPSRIQEVDRTMEVLKDLHSRVWRGRGRPGVFADPRFWLFHRAHARRAFRTNRLWLTTLQADGRAAGVTLCFRGRGRAHGYQLGHDPALREYGIGSLMIAISIRESIREGLGEMDFLRGAGPYKFHLASHERRGQNLVIHGGTVADRIARAVDRSRHLLSGLARGLLGQRGKQWLKDRLQND